MRSSLAGRWILRSLASLDNSESTTLAISSDAYQYSDQGHESGYVVRTVLWSTSILWRCRFWQTKPPPSMRSNADWVMLKPNFKVKRKTNAEPINRYFSSSTLAICFAATAMLWAYLLCAPPLFGLASLWHME